MGAGKCSKRGRGGGGEHGRRLARPSEREREARSHAGGDGERVGRDGYLRVAESEHELGIHASPSSKLQASGAISEVAGFSLAHMFEVAWKSALVLVVWSGADYLLERQKLESDLRMSRQDLMDEFKETEGHPQIKGRIRRLQRQLRKRRMLEQVKRASVVITNPNEFAVALEYRPQMAAPMATWLRGRSRN